MSLRWLRPIEIGLGSKVVPKKQLGPWLRKALDGSGPTYIKIGQFISNRPDIFGKELARELAPLRDSVTPFPFEQVRDKVPEGVTGVEEKPIASASIAQVHRAKLKGKNVVLKFKRPGIESQIKEDLELIKKGASVLDQIHKILGYFIRIFYQIITKLLNVILNPLWVVYILFILLIPAWIFLYLFLIQDYVSSKNLGQNPEVAAFKTVEARPQTKKIPVLMFHYVEINQDKKDFLRTYRK
mgnify:CR=1 FL=1